MGRASLNERETWRMKLTLGKHCCVNPNLFLGRGHSARWFVLQQALQISPPLSGQEHGSYCTTWSAICSTCESYLEACVWINGCISSSFEMLNMQSANASAVCFSNGDTGDSLVSREASRDARVTSVRSRPSNARSSVATVYFWPRAAAS
jgi:hypothetical protein